MVVYHRISRIFIAVRTETRDFFFCTLFAYIRKLPIFCHIFPIIELVHEFLVAVNAFVLHKFATIFAFSWFFETHHLVKVRIELKRFLATPEIAFENFWVFLQLIVALVAFQRSIIRLHSFFVSFVEYRLHFLAKFTNNVNFIVVFKFQLVIHKDDRFLVIYPVIVEAKAAAYLVALRVVIRANEKSENSFHSEVCVFLKQCRVLTVDCWVTEETA